MIKSRIGFGGFRLNNLNKDALSYAIRKGINVIDTASHFEHGESEKVIGNVVSSLIQNNEIKREVSYLFETIIKRMYVLFQNRDTGVKMIYKIQHQNIQSIQNISLKT